MAKGDGTQGVVTQKLLAVHVFAGPLSKSSKLTNTNHKHGHVNGDIDCNPPQGVDRSKKIGSLDWLVETW